MKAYELFEIINDCTYVELREYGELVGYYDGKNNIDNRYNFNNVVGLTVTDGKLIIDSIP